MNKYPFIFSDEWKYRVRRHVALRVDWPALEEVARAVLEIAGRVRRELAGARVEIRIGIGCIIAAAAHHEETRARNREVRSNRRGDRRALFAHQRR